MLASSAFPFGEEIDVFLFRRWLRLALAMAHAKLAAAVRSFRLVLPLFLFLAACIAMSGQTRAADAPGDSDDISFSFSDELVFTAGARLVLAPPDMASRALPLPPRSGPGRAVIADLFRPPIAA